MAVWMCFKNRLFCYPCLLFSTSDNVWIKTGFCDLTNLPRSFSKHDKSNIHIQSQISFKTFETSRIDLALNEQQRLNISPYNSKVKENREILKVLINGTCYLANQERAFLKMMRVRTCLIVAITSNLFTLFLKTMKEFLVIWRLP